FAIITSTTPLFEAPLTPTSSAPPTNVLDTVTQHDNANNDDFDDNVDTVELIDDKLCNLNFTPIK
ncbi:hypothetical protein KI387_024393, partial [Taxus chinensis]